MSFGFSTYGRIPSDGSLVDLCDNDGDEQQEEEELEEVHDEDGVVGGTCAFNSSVGEISSIDESFALSIFEGDEDDLTEDDGDEAESDNIVVIIDGPASSGENKGRISRRSSLSHEATDKKQGRGVPLRSLGPKSQSFAVRGIGRKNKLLSSSLHDEQTDSSSMDKKQRTTNTASSSGSLPRRSLGSRTFSFRSRGDKKAAALGGTKQEDGDNKDNNSLRSRNKSLSTSSHSTSKSKALSRRSLGSKSQSFCIRGDKPKSSLLGDSSSNHEVRSKASKQRRGSLTNDSLSSTTEPQKMLGSKSQSVRHLDSQKNSLSSNSGHNVSTHKSKLQRRSSMGSKSHSFCDRGGAPKIQRRNSMSSTLSTSSRKHADRDKNIMLVQSDEGGSEAFLQFSLAAQ
eukprot:CAMPEP_0172451564 /NCGR_PEP_ID=MMETSP1065-20121228/9559_1 /TAXON_ID=265537 /ORGANISM="Amphiprora paludosa, Strain CCMP125" /LENGTH=397 /DNA_ID=CAMNT_0013203527 /DNA_START=117 /DNA_END=1310 /DNA_ORIENTATION=+